MGSTLSQWLNSLSIWGIYTVILILTAIIYQTAFARKIPILKQLIVYLVLAVGCFLLVIFHYMGLPIVPALLITVVLIVGTRARLSYLRRKNKTVTK